MTPGLFDEECIIDNIDGFLKILFRGSYIKLLLFKVYSDLIRICL